MALTRIQSNTGSFTNSDGENVTWTIGSSEVVQWDFGPGAGFVDFGLNDADQELRVTDEDTITTSGVGEGSADTLIGIGLTNPTWVFKHTEYGTGYSTGGVSGQFTKMTFEGKLFTVKTSTQNLRRSETTENALSKHVA